MHTFLIILSALSIAFSHLSFKDGLTTGSVTDVHFDEKGMVWIGTGNGLNSYDGNRVYNHPASKNSVMRLAGDGNGTLYVACRGELYAIDLRSLEHKTISQDDSRAIAYHEGHLYVATGNILKRYSNGISMPETSAVLGDSDNITALVISKDGTAWMGTENGDIVSCSLTDGHTKRWHAGSLVENLFLDSKNTLWAATFADGITQIDRYGGVKRLFSDAKNGNSLSSNFVRSICEDDNGNYWIGTFSGLDYFDCSTNSFTHFSPDRIRPESLSNSSVWVVKKDSQGTIWAGTFFGGLNYFNPDFSIYKKFPDTSSDGIGLSSPIIRMISEGWDGKVLVATEGGGFNIIDPDTFLSTCYTKNSCNRISENNVKAFVYDKKYNCVWIGTHLGGLDRIDIRSGKSAPFRPSGNPGDNSETDDILSMSDGGDSLYVGTTKGLFIFSKQTAHYRRISGTKSISDIKQDPSGNVWFSSGELYRYDPKSFSTQTYLSGKYINNICVLKNGRLALGSSTTRGLILFDPQSRTSEIIDMSGLWLDSERAQKILESPASGKLLISSDRGFSILNSDGTAPSYHCAGNGFPLDNMNDHAMMATPDGTVYVGGLSGMVSFREESLFLNKKPFFIAFSKLITDGENRTNILYESSLIIPSGISSISIEFLSSNHIAENTSSFEYKMDGLSKKWTKIWGDNSISFTNLPYGKYTLHIRPVDTDPSVCDEISIPIKVLPPWYLSGIARLIYVLLLCCVIYFGLHKLVVYLNQRENDRLAAIQQNDRERFNTFERATSIVYSNLDNCEFNISEFASEMALSRSALFEKIKAATGSTPNDFVLDIRLKEGMKLLKNNPELNVSDISYRVGFSSPHYFSKCFKARFGESPLAWRKTQTNINL